MKLSWGDNVERSQVREEGLVGTLFLPEKTPAPAIITIFGGVNRWITFVAIFLFSLIDFLSTLPFHLVHDQYIRWSRGSVPEDRAALLASKGFVTLALAFFGVDHLPKVIFEIMIRIVICHGTNYLFVVDCSDLLWSGPWVLWESIGLGFSSRRSLRRQWRWTARNISGWTLQMYFGLEIGKHL